MVNLLSDFPSFLASAWDCYQAARYEEWEKGHAENTIKSLEQDIYIYIYTLISLKFGQK